MTHLELDPDPTLTATAWREYLAAAQTLDAVRREAASASAIATSTMSCARAELARARAKLDQQRTRLVHEAVQAGVACPPLDPSPAEQESARTNVTPGASGALAALRHCHTLIETADAQLAEAASRSSRWPPRPWLIAAATAILVLVASALLLGVVLR